MDEETTESTTEDSSEDVVVEIGKYKVQVIRDLCIGAASCLAFAPATFVLDDEKKAVIQDGSTDTDENVLLAAQSCPTKAIILTDKETGEKIWPT